MRFMALRLVGAAFLVSGLFLCATVHAEELQDCTGGRPDASSCLKQLKAADAELQTLNQLLKKKAAAKPVAGVSSALRRSHLAWLAYRDAQCGLEHLLDGTTDQYRQAMVASCRLGMTRERIQDVRRQTEL
jgi:uncharacterized protein YecT (DUF1311 family)